MKKRIVYSVLAAVIVVLNASISYAGIKLELVTGQTKTIEVKNAKRVAIGNPEIADFGVISSREIRVVAKSEGVTTLEIWGKDNKVTEYDLQVIAMSSEDIIKKVTELLGTDILRIITLKTVEGGRILMEGEYDTQEDAKKIQEVTQSFGGQLINFIKPSKVLMENSTFLVSQLIGVDSVNVRLVNKTILLDGLVPTKEDKERAEKIAELFNKDVVNTLKIGSNQLVQVDVKIYEMNAEFTADLDINLLSPAQLTTMTDFSYKLLKKPTGGLFTSFLGIDNELNAAVGQGKGKLLAKPKLVTVSGGKATFKSGGERGYTILSSIGTPSIEWKHYGIELEIEPLLTKLNGSDNINLHVNALISDLENLDATIAVASLSSSNAEVSVCMKPEETLLIAGLLKNKKSKKVSRFPILGFIPIIEILFKSVKEEISERELLMFITPRIVSARQSPKEVINTDTDRQNKEYNKLIIKE